MSLTKYIYNTQTLRYERAPVHWIRLSFTAIGILCVGFLFFVGLVFLQNLWTDSPEEVALRAENEALVLFKNQLDVRLVGARAQLSDLEQKDKSLYEKIFEVKRTDETKKTVSKELLLTDVDEFGTVIGTLLSRSNELVSTEQARSSYFGEHLSITKDDVTRLSSLPSISPLANMDASNLVSGYGKRINPFHKGLYHHDGIDLAAPRGTEVVAAGKGIVTATSTSNLQAGFGNYLVIDHGNGYVTQYSNLGTIEVRYGQRINKGQVIGTIGISGGSIAPHVHYVVLHDGHNIDPVKFLMGGLTADQYESIWVASREQNQSLD